MSIMDITARMEAEQAQFEDVERALLALLEDGVELASAEYQRFADALARTKAFVAELDAAA